MTHHANFRLSERGRSPKLPAFCRTRQRSATTVGLSALQQLQWLLWLLLALQLSTILLLLSGPMVLTVPAANPAKTVAEFIQFANAKQGGGS